ncbi:hypothetical protein DERF_013553 [Dermatophagoides farinae]|uniref:Uncharacterized protein n=1 Tax=Dermatophagoides farinae TaxID=6954 RepID=A0A922HQF5_DERFA|nr:hypothetical protein DERF_013553 [Dermatophagoides farinae]
MISSKEQCYYKIITICRDMNESQYVVVDGGVGVGGKQCENSLIINFKFLQVDMKNIVV